MTLIKSDLVYRVQNEAGLTYREARKAVNDLFELMSKCLAEGEDILIGGFGKFSVTERTARKAGDPGKEEQSELPPRRVVAFKHSPILKKRLNKIDGN
jgi:integration host factor subunit alpha